jgi:putative transposase
MLEQHGIRISMDGKGSYSDNLFIERLWRTVKYEEVYLKAYRDGSEARAALADYFRFYNNQRPHQGLGYRTPAAVYNASCQNTPAVGQTAGNHSRKTAGLHLNPVSVLS